MSNQDTSPVKTADVVISKSLDYKITASSAPKYKMSLLVPQSGSQTATVLPGSSIETLIELPAGKAYNLANSVLYFTVTPATSGALNFNWHNVDFNPTISRIQLSTRGGAIICDINNLHKYLNLVQKVTTSNEKFLNRSKTDFLFPNNSLTDVATAIRPPLADAAGANHASKAYIEPSYAVVGGVNSATPVNTFQFNLGDIPHSVFSVDKDLYFNEVLVLRIDWAKGQDYLWYSTSATDPTAGATAIAVNTAISNISMYLAVETDDMIVQSLRSKVNSTGLEVLIPYVYHFKNNLTGTSQNISLRFNSAHGMSLCRVYSAAFNNDETKNLAFDHSNINGAKVSSYYTMIDNSRITEFDIACTDARPIDYMNMKDLLKGTPIQNIDVFRFNWLLCDDFCKDVEVNNDPNVVNGLALTQQERKWDLQATTTNDTYNWYTFAITKRKLVIGPQMIVVQ